MTAKSIIPCITYNNALETIEWLCGAFGFEKHQVYLEDDGLVSHAELKLGNAMIMVGSQQFDSPFGRLVRHPKDMEGYETQSPYIVLENIDKHYERAKKHGAKIVMELEEKDYGGKNYACYDPEGHLWNFGMYDPWKIKTG